MNDTRHLANLRARVAADETFKYLYFWGHQPGRDGVTASCFSQWYDAGFEVDGRRYATAEHYMMAEKAALFGDAEAREAAIAAPTPGAAKAAGRTVSNFEEAVWLQHRFDIVCRANAAKFARNPHLGAFLLGTGEQVLVEASPVDAIWGIGLAHDDPRAVDPREWQGLTLLGFALMQVRADMRNA